MKNLQDALQRWALDVGQVREHLYRAPTPRERERWHALWLLLRGWSAAQVAEALARDAHTIGQWVAAFRQRGPTGLAFEQTGGTPRPQRGATGDPEGGRSGSTGSSGIHLADWNWKVVREFVQGRFRVLLRRSSCLNYLHRLGFVLKRPKKRLLKADAAQREAFVAAYAALVAEARATGARIFFVDEAHFYADADLRRKWVLKEEPALVDSTSPRWGEKASYYSAVCLGTREVEVMELEGNSTAETRRPSCDSCGPTTPAPLSSCGTTARPMAARPCAPT